MDYIIRLLFLDMRYGMVFAENSPMKYTRVILENIIFGIR